MSLILIQRDRVRDLLWLGIDLDRNAGLAQHSEQLPIESGDRFWRECESTLDAIRSAKLQPVVNKIELDLKRLSFIWNRRGREPSRVDIEGRVPSMVLERSQAQPDFPHNLSPHVKRVIGVFPLFERQGRPVLLNRPCRKRVLRMVGVRAGCHDF